MKVKLTTRNQVIAYANRARTGDMITIACENGVVIQGAVEVAPGSAIPTVMVDGFEVASDLFNNLTNFAIEELWVPIAS